MRFTVVLQQESDGGFVVTVPALPGCVSQGDTRPQAIENLREANSVYREDCVAAEEELPVDAGREIIEVQSPA